MCGIIELMTSFFAVYFFYWAQPISTDGYGLQNDLRGKRRRRRKKTGTPPFSCPLLPLHTVFHQTIVHCYMKVVFPGVSARFVSLSLPLCCFLPPFRREVSLAVYCRPSEGGRERRREREKQSGDTGNVRGSALWTELEGLVYNVQRMCTGRLTCSPFYPWCTKACSYYLFKSPTFVHWYWHS